VIGGRSLLTREHRVTLTTLTLSSCYASRGEPPESGWFTDTGSRVTGSAFPRPCSRSLGAVAGALTVLDVTDGGRS
jgi:hypothetical protein